MTKNPVFTVQVSGRITVVAVGEIKSTLATSELQDSVAKIRNVKSLDRRINNATCYRQYGSSYIIQGGNSQTYDPVNKPWDQIYGFILCQKFKLRLTTLAKKYYAFCSQAAPHLAPNIVLSLADGLMMFADHNGDLLRNAVGAKNVAFFGFPGGNFQFLLNDVVYGCQRGRTTDVLPYLYYILGNHHTSQVKPTYISVP